MVLPKCSGALRNAAVVTAIAADGHDQIAGGELQHHDVRMGGQAPGFKMFGNAVDGKATHGEQRRDDIVRGHLTQPLQGVMKE